MGDSAGRQDLVLANDTDSQVDECEYLGQNEASFVDVVSVLDPMANDVDVPRESVAIN